MIIMRAAIRDGHCINDYAFIGYETALPVGSLAVSRFAERICRSVEGGGFIYHIMDESGGSNKVRFGILPNDDGRCFLWAEGPRHYAEIILNEFSSVTGAEPVQ